jgi:hypothetical protein
MLEKSGEIVLTEEEIKKSKKGVVSKRIQEDWGLTAEQLSEIVEDNNYKVTTDK